MVNGALGVGPGSAITGFPPGIVNGTIHAADAVAAQGQADLTAAYDDAAGRTPPAVLPADAGGLFLTPGVYQRPAGLGLTGNVTLDAQGDPAAVFVLQAGTLTTASNSRVVLTGSAQPCNVFWQIASSATLGSDTAFVGDILARESITLNTRATMLGRVLARNGAVTLDTNSVDRQDCSPGTGTGSDPGGGGPGGSGGATGPGGGGTQPAGGAPGTTGATAPGGGTGPGGAGSPPGATTPVPGTTQASATGNGAALAITQPRGAGRTIAQTGTKKCVDGGFRVAVRGKFIRKVTFLVDGRRVAIQDRSPFAFTLHLHGGTHKLRAKVYFTDGTRVRNIRFAFRACSEQSRRATTRPSFPG